MDLNKPLRIIWLINGIALLLGILYWTGTSIAAFLSRTEYVPPEVIVGDKLTDAQKEGLALQGLRVSEVLRVAGSNGYLVPAGIKTYDVPKEAKVLGSRNFDGYANFSAIQLEADSYDMVSREGYINLIFTDEQFVVRRKLLDQKAFIARFTYPTEGYRSEPIENPIPFIGYLLCLGDTNKDGAINDEDQSDLYLSSLQGENLVQVTKGIEIVDFRFLNPKEIFIQYFKRKEEREEYQRLSFMVYQIDSKKLDELKSLNEMLDAIETGLSK